MSHPGLADPSRPTPDWQALRRAIYFVPQRLEPWSGAIADELHLHLARCGVRGGENERRVTNALRSLGLAEVREKPWHHLSGGFQLRVELARAILSPVRLLVLDEPLASLDAPAMVEILAFLRDLAADPKTRLTVVLTSHHLHEVESICSFMVALDAKGRAKPYTTRGACLEVSGDFPAELYEHLYARGCTWRTSSRREATSLIEHDTAEIPELWRIFLEAYGLYGGEIVNLRDVSRSLARIGAEL